MAFRLWRPKRSCAAAAYQTKPQLAAGMLTELVAARLPFQYLVADTHYTAGQLRLVVTRNRHGNCECLATNELTADLNRVVERKHSRWSVETIFRDTKQYAGLGACQCFTDQAMVRHIALVLVGFVVLQQLRLDPSESLAAVIQEARSALEQRQDRDHPG